MYQNLKVNPKLLLQSRFFVITMLFLCLAAALYTEYIYDEKSDCNSFKGKYEGVIYRAPWNSEDQLLFRSEDFTSMVYCYDLSLDMKEKLAKGEYVYIFAEFETAELPSNPNEFNMNMYLKSRGVDYITYLDDKDIECKRPENLWDNIKFYPKVLFSRLRYNIRNVLNRFMKDSDTDLICAVMTGETGLLEKDHKSKINDSGLSHLMAVSGMHVNFILLPFTKLFANRYLDIKKRNLMLLIPGISFLFIADLSVSVTRSTLMVICKILSKVLEKPYDILNALCLSGSIQIMINPFVIKNLGFLLSYGAVLSLIFIHPLIMKYKILVKYRLSSGIAVNIGLFPILISYTGQYSLVGLILNILASPLAFLVFTGGFLLYISGLAFSDNVFMFVPKLISYALKTMIYFLDSIITIGGEISRFIKITGDFKNNSIFMILCYTFILMILLKKKIPFKRCLGIYLTILFSLFLYGNIVKEHYIVFFDVDQGAAALIQTDKGICGLIDTGKEKENIYRSLKDYGVDHLDFLVITHGDTDHSGGAKDLIDNMKINMLFIPDNTENDITLQELCNIALDKGIKVVKISDTAAYSYPDLNLFFIGPFEKSSDLNHASLVVKANIENKVIYFTGDIDINREEELYGAGLLEDCDILSVAHHGSDTSTGDKFLSKTFPEYAIISVGKDNSYGHPSENVINRLEKYTSEIYYTDEHGYIRIKIDSNIISGKKDLEICTAYQK